MDKNIIIVNKPHSIVDVITNSSTELFIVDKSKTLEIYQELLDMLMDMEIDYESEICKFNDSEDNSDIELLEGCNPEDLYVINASYHNAILNKFINDFFYTVEWEWKGS